MDFVVVGYGSMGKRHANTLLDLGHGVAVVDPNQSGNLPKFHNLRYAVDSQPDGMVICSPPEDHYPQAMMCLEAGVACFVEKPLAMTAAAGELMCKEAEKQGVPLAVGYQLRCDQALVEAKKTANNIISATFTFGYDIRKWHPPEHPYEPRIGVLMEASHEIDLALWMFGMPDYVRGRFTWRGAFCDSERRESAASVWLHYGASNSTVIVTLLLDYMRPQYRRDWEIVTEDSVYHIEFSKDVNEQCYRDEIKAFAGACESNDPSCVACTGREGLHTLRVVETMRSGGGSVLR